MVDIEVKTLDLEKHEDENVEDKKGKKPRKAFTGMFLTWNTNRKFDDENDPECIELRNRLRAAEEC